MWRPKILVLSLAMTGCGFIDGFGDDEGGDSTQANIGEYEQLRLSLEAQREQILPEAAVDYVSAVGSNVLWLDIYQGWEAVLHIRHYPDGNEVVSSVPIGDEETPPFYRASETHAMTGLTVGMDSRYSIIDLSTGDLVDEVLHKKPQAAKYDAYGLYGNDAYLVVEDEGKMIYSWPIGSSAPTPIGAIDDTGINLGAWIDFTLVEYGGKLNLIALGTLGTFSIDLATMSPTQIPLPISPLEMGLSDVGVAVIDGFDLWFVGWGDSEVRAVHDEIKNSGYELNSSFYNSHWVGSGTANVDVSMDGSTIYYRSVSGVHAYDVDTQTVTPVLLDDANYSGAGLFVRYTNINVAENMMLVMGLESTDGSNGADGPVYRVQLF